MDPLPSRLVLPTEERGRHLSQSWHAFGERCPRDDPLVWRLVQRAHERFVELGLGMSRELSQQELSRAVGQLDLAELFPDPVCQADIQAQHTSRHLATNIALGARLMAAPPARRALAPGAHSRQGIDGFYWGSRLAWQRGSAFWVSAARLV